MPSACSRCCSSVNDGSAWASAVSIHGSFRRPSRRSGLEVVAQEQVLAKRDQRVFSRLSRRIDDREQREREALDADFWIGMQQHRSDVFRPIRSAVMTWNP